MGYYANCDGYIKFKQEPSKEIKDLIESRISASYNKHDLIYEIGEYDKYYEEDVYEIFEKTHGMVEEGEIDYHGEDDTYWRFIYIPEKEAWAEQSGRIVYDE